MWNIRLYTATPNIGLPYPNSKDIIGKILVKLKDELAPVRSTPSDSTIILELSEAITHIVSVTNPRTAEEKKAEEKEEKESEYVEG